MFRVTSGKPVAPVIIDTRNGVEDDDEDDTFIVEDDPSLQNLLEVVSNRLVSEHRTSWTLLSTIIQVHILVKEISLETLTNLNIWVHDI